jgi:flagellar motor switch protein FliN/FliY
VAAVLHAALRRAHAGVASKVIAAGPAAALARDLAHGERAVTTAWLTVLVGPDAFEARVSVPDGATVRPRVPALSRGDLLAMGDAALALPLVVASTLASRAELQELAVGDAFVPRAPSLRLASDGTLRGPVALVPARGERGISADLAEGGRLVVRGLLESHPWEREMSSDPSATTTTEILEDAAVVVRVELGTVELKAREWADLGPGDVVSLGRKVGDHAILRVGGVELGRGELVVVDGEYAVRILARATSATGTGTGTGTGESR